MITVDSRGLDRKLDKLLRVMRPQSLLRLVASGQLGWIDRNFREEGAERGWKPLSPGTVYARRRGSSKPLQDTGRLKQSFTMRVAASQAVVGTNMIYAGFHHAGTKPYTITAKGKLLTIPNPGGSVEFEGTKNGRLDGKRGFFARSVNHPGLPARPLLPTKALAERMAAKTIEATLRKAGAG